MKKSYNTPNSTTAAAPSCCLRRVASLSSDSSVMAREVAGRRADVDAGGMIPADETLSGLFAMLLTAPPKRAGDRGVMVNPLATWICCREVSTAISATVKKSFIGIVRRG